MEWKQEAYRKIEEKIEKELNRMGNKIPYIAEDGIYKKDMKEENICWWTNGFFAGILWQLYNVSKKTCFLEGAEKIEEILDEAFTDFIGLHHDVGFMWLHTSVANYRLTGNEKSRVRGLHAATVLAGRYNGNGEFIRAWNLDKTGWMIVDSMMNIPLLFWAAEEFSDSRFSYIAKKHADTALRVLVREDGSCNHIVVFNPDTGEVLEKPAGQGYAEGSSWSRGQAWALYGFALAYRYTKKQEYLDAAKKIAHYVLANIITTDYIARVDFRSPKEPIMWDTTASACIACGLLEIAEHLSEYESLFYSDNAEAILKSLNKQYCNWNVEEDGILQYGTAAYHLEEDTHVPIIYGDYFLAEGIIRLLNKSFLIW